MKVEKYNAVRLKEFLGSERYRSMPFVPVSQHRALSWLNNPRMEPEDILMYVAFEGEDMVAYRCIMPDRYGEIRFGWLSGNWVRPDLRRRGIASKLFEEAFHDWGHQLMFTNYAPESKAVYDKSTRFELYRERPGMRYYIRSSSAVLMGNRRTIYRRSRPLLSLADGILNTVQDVRTALKREDVGGLNIGEKEAVDLQAVDFMERMQGTGFCARTHEDFDWITGFPWVKAGPARDDRYFFSSVSRRFRNICLTLRDAGGDIYAFLWLVLNGEKMTLPYAVLAPGTEPDASRILNHYLQSNRVSYLTTYHSRITSFFHPSPMLGARKMSQNYFATRELLRQFPDPGSVPFQDGDGDVVFV